MPKRLLTPQRLLPAALAALVIMAVAPARYTQWASALHDPALFLVRPISHPLASLGRTLRPAGPRVERDDPRVEALEAQRDDLATRLARAQHRITELERLVRDLQRGMGVMPEVDVRAFAAPITGASSDLASGTIQVGAGRRQGVVANSSVAVTRGDQLVGRVVSVDTRTSWVLPITHVRSRGARQPEWIEALVFTGDDIDQAWACQLRAVAGGLLEGDMVAEAAGIERGQIVRLRDPSWPGSAQMLVLGRVESVHRKENQRLVVTVRPGVDLTRVSEVVLRVPIGEEAR